MQVYAVGGSVRDELLGLPVNDRDWVVVGGSSEDMLKRGFEQVGAAFPVFLHPRTKEEYALARTEKKSGTGYLGFEVQTENVTLEQDLSRRDLTINAMARAQDGSLVDPFDGARDLTNKVLRHVSDAFMEDPLRVVRLARFYARYTDFSIAVETVKMAQTLVLSGEMNTISRERYWAELLKVMQSSGDPRRFFDALQLFGAFNHVEFFSSVFGNKPTSMLVSSHAGAVAKVAKEMFDPEKAVLVTVAGSAKLGADLSASSSDVVAVHDGLYSFIKMDTTSPEQVLQFLKKLRAANKTSKTFHDLVDTLKVLNALQVFVGMPTAKLLEVARVVQSVSPAPFVVAGLTGAQIGAALDAARLEKLTSLLKG